MRHFMRFALLLALVVGCSKKKPPEADDTGANDPTPADATAAERTRLLAALKGTNQKAKQEAIDELSAWVDTDPATVVALVELLKDRTTAGTGKTAPTHINSTREAAVRTLLLAGPNGTAAIKEKALPVLRAGLSDPSAMIREHTAYTVGLLRSLGKPLSPDVMKLCTHSSANVRGVAFDALRAIGVTDVPGFVALLNNENPDIAQLAAEHVRELSNIPAEAVPALITAVESEDQLVRTAAAVALGRVGSKAGSAAADALAETIRKSFATPYNPNKLYDPRPDEKYWEALRRIGEPAVGSLGALLADHHPIVRGYAAHTIGDIGKPARAVADKLKIALKDEYGFVALEAACALCRVGEERPEAIELVKRMIDAPDRLALQAIDAISSMGDAGKPLIPLALQKLTSDNKYARYAALALVPKVDRAEAVKLIDTVALMLKDREGDIRGRAGQVLEKLGTDAAPAAEALGQALATEKNEGVRHRYIEALIAMKATAKPAIPALLPFLADKTLPLKIRTKLPGTVAVTDPTSREVVAALIAVTGENDQVMRFAAIEALARLDPLADEALARLVAVAKSETRLAPRVAALRGLATAGPRATAARGEVEPIAAGSQEDLALWGKVVLAAMDGDVTKASATIRAGLTDKSQAVRAAAAEAFLFLEPTAADLPVLMKLLKDPGSTAKEASAKSIKRLGAAAKEAVPQLITLLGEGNNDVRLAAIEALAQMGPAGQPAFDKLETLRSDPVVGEAAKKALEKLGWKER